MNARYSPKPLLLAFSFATLSLASALADTVNLSGDTTGAPTFNRPTETGARSMVGGAVPFNTYQFNVSTSGQFTFTLTAIDPSSYDTFLHLFVNSFDPADTSDPAANFLAGNDDRVLNQPDLGSGLSIQLNSGTSYFFVVDGFGNTDFGPYNASITGPGTIDVVPEPSTVALLGLAAVGLVVYMRRGFRSARV